MSAQSLPAGSARRIFDEALQQPEGERQGFLRDACGTDEALRQQIERLLAAHQRGEERYPEPATGEQVGDRIGPYKLLELIGEGGFGAVWMAEQGAPLRRRVALKMLKWGMDTRAVVARFEAERQALALMDHPHIAHVHDAGATASGRPYFVMELVHGVPITRYCDDARLSPRERLELFQRVCEAVQHAHQKGIIHRDIKPSNVLVTLLDGRPVPKVIDFGIAKATSGQLTDRTLFTGFLQVVGTPEYMAPEQAEMTGIDVDTRADVYSLGVLLYELLTGTKPFELEQIVPLGIQELLRRIREVEPERPSTRISTLGERLVDVCSRRRMHPRAFSRWLHGDLDWILLKALEKERARRYPTAERLAADIGRHLAGEPVEASPPSLVYRLRKWLRRHQIGAVAIAAVATALVVGAAIAWSGYDAALEQEAIATARAKDVLRLSSLQDLEDMIDEADSLWPPYPENITNYTTWIQRASALVAELPQHYSMLDELQSMERPGNDDARTSEGKGHTRFDRDAPREGLRVSGADLPPPEDEHGDRRLSKEQSERRWWIAQVTKLIVGLENLKTGLLANDAVTEHGWSVPRRLAFATELRAGFGAGGQFASAWERALPEMRRSYPGLDLKPQMGLLPIGPDPDSGLWEFAHLMTGAPAERGPDGKLVLTEDTGVVLVLLPEGRFWMGAQSIQADGRHYDPQADDDEGPVHEVELSAFFLSKYELTQGQWSRVATRRTDGFDSSNASNESPPSSGTEDRVLDPVAFVNWYDCMQWHRCAGLSLPSEAQWEYGARAGTDTVWWTGSQKESLAGAANLADAYAEQNGGTPWVRVDSWLNDGAAFHAAVGSYAANPFGLHDVLGNVFEWCQDGYAADFYRTSVAKDPLSPFDGVGSCIARGGGFMTSSEEGRSADRANPRKHYVDNDLGVRSAARFIAE